MKDCYTKKKKMDMEEVWLKMNLMVDYVCGSEDLG